jgi:hypothetical protein
LQTLISGRLSAKAKSLTEIIAVTVTAHPLTEIIAVKVGAHIKLLAVFCSSRHQRYEPIVANPAIRRESAWFGNALFPKDPS